MKTAVFLVLAVLAVSACIQQQQVQAGPACSAPYLLVGQDCCLDENGDGICDKDKPICNTPYILVAGRCCVDGNANGICDADELTTTSVTATSTTAAYRSTTTSERYITSTTENPNARCVTVDDCPSYDEMKCDGDGRVVNDTYGPVSCVKGVCKYRATRDIGAINCQDWEVCVSGVGCVRKDGTTTTTVSVQATSSTIIYSDYQKIIDRIASRYHETIASLETTTTTQPLCFDSDGGLKYETVSLNVIGYYDYNHTTLTGINESCVDGKKLTEFYCESNTLRTRVKECSSRCDGGRCCLEEGRTCEGSRDCCSGSCRAVGLSYLCVA